MPNADAQTGGKVAVLTFKHGLLSAVAHDLELGVGSFAIDWSEHAVTATFDLRTLRVCHAVVGGQPAPQALSARDRARIEQTIATDVLEVTRFPEARFESSSVVSTADGFVVRGHLTLKGRTRELSANVLRQAGRYTTELTLDQRDFGIQPYTAMLGTLRLEPEVHVRVSVPA